jgi:hypothetical protein
VKALYSHPGSFIAACRHPDARIHNTSVLPSMNLNRQHSLEQFVKDHICMHARLKIAYTVPTFRRCIQTSQIQALPILVPPHGSMQPQACCAFARSASIVRQRTYFELQKILFVAFVCRTFHGASRANSSTTMVREELQ